MYSIIIYKKVLMFICLFSKQSNICFFVLEVPLEPLEFPFSFCSASKSHVAHVAAPRNPCYCPSATP